jgi:Tfp pilus assembly protein PilF
VIATPEMRPVAYPLRFLQIVGALFSCVLSSSRKFLNQMCCWRIISRTPQSGSGTIEAGPIALSQKQVNSAPQFRGPGYGRLFLARMHELNQRVLLRITAFLLPILLSNSLCLPVRCQTNSVNRNHGGSVEIDVTIRDRSGELLSVPANVKLYLNGIPCNDGLTSNGRISFTMGDLGKYTVFVDAAGYQPGQNDVKVPEPQRVQLEITLQRETSSNSAPRAEENLILAPKAKEALEKGMRALRDDRLPEAEKALDDSIKLAPNNPHVLYVQGLLYLRKHEWTKAQSVLEKTTEMEPSSASAFAALGMALCDQKKYAEAIPPLEKSLGLDPASGWETHWSLAESYYHNERFAEALKVSQQAQAQSNGQVPQVDLLVARALTAVGRYEDSAKVLRELLKNHSDGPEAATARRFLERLMADGKIPRQ